MNELTRQQNISMTILEQGGSESWCREGSPPSLSLSLCPLPDAIVSYSVIVIMAMMLVIMVKCDGINYGFDEGIDWGYCSAGRVVRGRQRVCKKKNRCRLDDFCEWVPVGSEMHFVLV